MVKKQELNENMIANELEPFEPTHPGEVLKEEIEYRGIKATCSRNWRVQFFTQRSAERQKSLEHAISSSVVRGTRYRCGAPAKVADQI